MTQSQQTTFRAILLLCLTQTFGKLDLKFVMAASSLPKDLLRNPGLKDLVIKGLFVVFFFNFYQ